MPLEQRVIEPIYISRSTLPLPPGDIKPQLKSLAAATGQGYASNAATAANINIVNELECVTNGSLANLIRQLSSLSRQAEDLLSGVFEDASKLLTRTVRLQQRMDGLAGKIDSLDQPSDGPIILRDPTSQRESFSSDLYYDQQILSKQKMPPSIRELYEACDKPPPLNILNPYRDDGKEGLKFYTDPTYFFELWKKDMMKQQGNLNVESKKSSSLTINSSNQLDTIRRERQKQRSNQQTYGIVQPQQHMQQQQQPIYQQHQQINQQMIVQQQQQYQQQQQPIYQTQPMLQQQQQIQYAGSMIQNKPYDQNSSISDIQSRVSSLSVNSTTASVATATGANIVRQSTQSTVQNNQDLNQGASHSSPPPPPPPPPALSPLPPPVLSAPPPPKAPPSPPAPPAPPSISQPSTVLHPPTAEQLKQKQRELKKAIPVQRDPRSDLLAAIKQGITLRKVEDRKKVEAEKQTMGNDVASILARRVAMQASDSESNQGSDEDDQEWEQ